MFHWLHSCVLLFVAMVTGGTIAGDSSGRAPTVNGSDPAVAGFLAGDEKCRQATQYDQSDDTIVKCPDTIQCTNVNNVCLRRAVEIPGAIGITYCSCLPIQVGDPFPNEVCHIYRWHQGSTTRPLCTNEGCTTPQTCQLPANQSDLTVIQCSCR